MKLNINAKELLALYNTLHARFNSYDDECKNSPGPQSDDAQLFQLYGRLKACLLGSLNTRAADPLDQWLEGQKKKVEVLNEELDQVKQDQKDVVQLIDHNFLKLEDDDQDFTATYPRKGSRGPRQGKQQHKR